MPVEYMHCVVCLKRQPRFVKMIREGMIGWCAFCGDRESMYEDVFGIPYCTPKGREVLRRWGWRI